MFCRLLKIGCCFSLSLGNVKDNQNEWSSFGYTTEKVAHIHSSYSLTIAGNTHKVLIADRLLETLAYTVLIADRLLQTLTYKVLIAEILLETLTYTVLIVERLLGTFTYKVF